MNIKHKLSGIWAGASGRSKLAVKNMAASLALRGVSIATSLMVVPLTIDYLDTDQYGIWITISSIVMWANFFDLGLANGFRNRFAQAKANGDITLARQYVSTTYFAIGCIMAVLLGVIYLVNSHLDWPGILNVADHYYELLRKVFMILCVFFCMNMIANVFVKLAEADQRPAIGSTINCTGQLLSLLAIYLLTRYTTGGLLNMALYYAGIPFATMAVASLLLFNIGRYRQFRPSVRLIRPTLVKGLLNLGFRFFLIYLCMIAVFHLMNIVISRECGPYAVAQYNVAYKYLNVVYMGWVIVLGPMWSAFTDAYTKADYPWMRSTLRKLEWGLALATALAVVMVLCAPWVYHLWVGHSVEIPCVLSVASAVYVLSQATGATYMHMINGIGAIRLQLVIYVVCALVAYPLMTLCCRQWGVAGIVVVPSAVFLLQGLAGRIQLTKILNKTASGIWLKS